MSLGPTARANIDTQVNALLLPAAHAAAAAEVEVEEEPELELALVEELPAPVTMALLVRSESLIKGMITSS